MKGKLEYAKRKIYVGYMYKIKTMRIKGIATVSGDTTNLLMNDGRLIYFQDKKQVGNTAECMKVRIIVEEYV